jgi:hypothetical protein
MEYLHLSPLLALFFIVRRGLRPQRVKVNRLWLFPTVLTFLAVTSLGHSHFPPFMALSLYVVASVAGLALGWFGTQHVELTLDDATGTIMSKPTLAGTAVTAGVFLARFGVDSVMGGKPGPGGVTGWKAWAVAHGASLIWITNASLLFVAGRAIGRAVHMYIRTEPLLEQHRAAKLAAGAKGTDNAQQ